MNKSSKTPALWTAFASRFWRERSQAVLAQDRAESGSTALPSTALKYWRAVCSQLGGIVLPFCLLFASGSGALGEVTNSAVVSPVVTYQYYDAVGEETNVPVVSPVVYYQYFDATTNATYQTVASPSVSYFYQFGNSSSPVVLHGRVTDANGNPLPGATVAAMIYLNLVAQTTTDANGNYQMPSLSAGAYDLSAWDATYQTSMRGLTLNANTAEQDFQLNPMPSTPTTLQVNRSPGVPYTVGDLMGSQLLIYNGTSFVPITANNWPLPSLMTIVMTHGWIPLDPLTGAPMFTPYGVDSWPTDMATMLQSQGIIPATANIVAWDWHSAAMSDILDLGGAPADRTPDQGVGLGEALTNFLGTSYSQPVHFIGHSLGTIVNAAAANFLQGDPNENARRPVSSSPWTSPIHMTLFDEAQIAEIAGELVLQGGSDPTLLDAFNTAFANNSPPQNWQSPLPNNYTWADNYESLVAVTLPGAVNIWLQKTPYPFLDFPDIHIYSADWYEQSISNPTDPKNPLGFQNSYEFDGMNGLSFVAPNVFQQGSTYQQVLTDSDPLALEPVTGVSQYLGILPFFVIGGAEDLWQGTVQVVGQVAVDVENTAQQTAQSISQDFNYVSGVAAQGGQTVVNFFDSAVLQLTLTTTPKTTSSAQVQSGLVRPMGTPSGNNSANTPPMIWLPIQIPANAAALAFDFTVNGDTVDDWLVCGIGTNNLFSLEAKYIPTNQISASRLIDVTAWAGTTNELFFGFLGGTSTNATLGIDNIRFYCFQPPSLQAQKSGNNLVISWPLSAQNYSLQTTTNLADPNSWTTVTNVPAIVNLQNAITNPASDGARFFRLKK